jgi:type VI secretion system protein VasJ
LREDHPLPDAPAALGATPIAGPNPAGVSARYEPEFEKLSAEIAKLESVEGRASIRWEDVVSLATTLLASKSKDLLVAGYLTLGLARKKGFKGLETGLQACRDMIATFWDGLFPEKNRMRARSSALQWMSERVEAAVTAMSSPSKSDREVLTNCANLLGELGTLVGEKFTEDAPDLGGLTRAVQEKLDAIPADAPPPSETPAEQGSATEASSGAAPAEMQALPAVGAVGTPEEARQAIVPACQQFVEIAAALRQAAPTDALPYRLLRVAIWSDLTEAPPSAEGVTQLTGGDAAFAAEQEARLDKGEYAPVIDACEARFPSDSFWLDQHLFVFRAMEGLGRPYAAARKAVEDMVAWVARGVPGMLDLKFADGTPLAGEATRLWILNELGALPSKGMSGGGGRPTEAALAEARKLAARKEFPKATAVVQKALMGLVSRRDRFAGRLDLARLCLEGGHPELARPLLEALDQESRAFPLEEWEPGLCVELARELAKCYSALSAPEKMEEAYGRLCRLDLSAALDLKIKR